MCNLFNSIFMVRNWVFSESLVLQALRSKNVYWRFTFTSNGKRKFVPRDQVQLYPFTCSLLFIISRYKLVVSSNFLSIRIVLSCFYLLIFSLEKFSTWIWRLPFAIYVQFRIINYRWIQTLMTHSYSVSLDVK